MKIVVPKASRGILFDRLFSIEMNSFDVEGVLSALFYLVITRGRQRAGRTNDAKEVERYLGELVSHERMIGFDNPEGRRLLARWVRSSVVRMGRVGRARTGEQIEYVLPLTLLTYKTGLPMQGSRQRNVHLFLYRILIDTLAWADVKPSPEAVLDVAFRRAFGHGVIVGDAPKYDGRYDGTSELDLHALLSLNYLDGFEPTPASNKEALVSAHGEALPAVARAIGRDILLFIAAYHGRVPSLALTRGIMALIGFELFAYTTKLVYATNELVSTGIVPHAMEEGEGSSLPDLYVDFTRERGRPSDEMARACVERDMEELRAFYESVLRLRTVHRYVEAKPQLRDRLRNQRTSKYLQSLVRLSTEDQTIEARAEMEVEAIKQETLEACRGDGDREEAETLFRELERRFPESALDRAVWLLVAAQQKDALWNYVKWFWSIGGLRKPFGLLDGALRGRRNWRYAMSDDLLAALVHLALIRDPSGHFEVPSIEPRMRLGEFLGFLDRRFGVTIDRPPAFLDSAMYRAAAKENLESLRRRLRQMGLFEELSDDFTAQYLRAPILEEVGV